MNGLSDIVCAALVCMTADVLNSTPLTKAHIILHNQLNWLHL